MSNPVTVSFRNILEELPSRRNENSRRIRCKFVNKRGESVPVDSKRNGLAVDAPQRENHRTRPGDFSIKKDRFAVEKSL